MSRRITILLDDDNGLVLEALSRYRKDHNLRRPALTQILVEAWQKYLWSLEHERPEIWAALWTKYVPAMQVRNELEKTRTEKGA